MTACTKADKAFIPAELSLSDNRELGMRKDELQSPTRRQWKGNSRRSRKLNTLEHTVDKNQPHTCQHILNISGLYSKKLSATNRSSKLTVMAKPWNLEFHESKFQSAVNLHYRGKISQVLHQVLQWVPEEKGINIKKNVLCFDIYTGNMHEKCIKAPRDRLSPCNNKVWCLLCSTRPAGRYPCIGGWPRVCG